MAPPHAEHRRGAAEADGAHHRAAPERVPAAADLDRDVPGHRVDVGADAPFREGQRIRRVPVGARVVDDAQVHVARLRIGAAVGFPADAAPAHLEALKGHPSSHIAPSPTSTAVRINPARPMVTRLLFLLLLM